MSAVAPDAVSSSKTRTRMSGMLCCPRKAVGVSGCYAARSARVCLTPDGIWRFRQRRTWRAARAMLVLLLVVASGCVGTTGHIAAVSTHHLDATDLLTEKPAQH